ncbi:50S ribosomal protein L11 methyltransferase [Flavobacteriaceae bacterium]|nr:50S ribosomal protein L11 methyltransferase [Flavobacteriaceae bacterium]
MADPVYIGYTFKVIPVQPGSEILIAELGYTGFESFVETPDGVVAYIQQSQHFDLILDSINILKSEEFEITYTFEIIKQTNWNAEWEKNFNPIVVGDQCAIRAPFHDSFDVDYDIIIEPKMSFGTGHHETTHMMIEYILASDFTNNSVLDMGCGTGVLAILAKKKGAHVVEAIDIDNWCYLNSLENISRNDCGEISVLQGDASLLKGKRFDVIIANINRNILLEDLSTYVACLNENSSLFLSGFYDSDCELIESSCLKLGLKFETKLIRNSWVALKFVN